MTLFKNIYSSPLGDLSLIADEDSLLGVWFLGQKYFERGLEGPFLDQETEILLKTKQALDDYFAGREVDFRDLPLAQRGTAFQERVWAYLRALSWAETKTYGQLAQDLGVSSAQAVGGAVGRNPWSILVPCHRVLGSQGQLTGYAGGLEKKIWLLEHEGLKLR
ncbi:methylated-DNA--[protein]-cysteine S-methyltransferase [Streptococcus oricebi]|uniref:Methylated-DNA--protein-cysteine methyltransferase n=1 Tax=Streptococcus oricebi TaxID=1547447 RepID=A0ABS5B4E3_9STRE|nr:methylated-DNA--[protein]-cysteine S-methyltransferase [Streptococcus oricebi]MBP2623343.1 cysteine methyltransferase [Streptococcus oricebi]